MNYLKKIKDYTFEITVPYKVEDAENIIAIERQLGVVLPEDYKAFIRQFGTICFTSPVMFKSSKPIANVTIEGNLGRVGRFFNWGKGDFSINKEMQMRSDQISKRYVPFAEGELGDFIGFMFRNREEYSVAYFFHEGPIGDTINDIAFDFKEFILSLTEHEIKLTDEQRENLNKSYRLGTFSPKMIELLKKTGKWKG